MYPQKIYRLSIYLAGLAILALGITLNTKTGFGVSAVISVPYSLSVILNISIGDMTLIVYSIFALVQMILHLIARKRPSDTPAPSILKIVCMDALQIPLSIVFTRFMNLFSDKIPVLTTLSPNSFFGSYVGRFLVLFIAVTATGVGAAMSLNMRLIPNPGDGIIQGISDFTGKNMGLVKNCFDGLSLIVALIISLICTGHIIGIGIGTVAAVIGIGRVIAIFNHLTLHTLLKNAGMDASIG